MPRFPVIALALCLPISASAAEFGGYLTLTSDFVRRGVSQSDTDPAVQLGGDLSLDRGLVLGVWGSSVDNRSQPGNQRDVEVNAYAGYGWDIRNDWRLTGFVIAYAYPGMDTPFDYGYVEYLVSANFKDRYWVETAFAPDYYGTGDGAWNVEALGEWPLSAAWNLSAGIGRFDLDDVVGAAYTYWQAGVTRNVGIINLDLRYYDTNRTVPFFSSRDTAKGRIVVSLTIPF